MKNYLDMLSDQSLQNENEEVMDDVELFDENENLEESTIALTSIEILHDETITLESMIMGLRSAVNLSSDTATFANNYINATSKRYGITAPLLLTQESSSSGNQLTLEAAEELQEGLWERFKRMVRGFFESLKSLLSSIILTTNMVKKKISELKQKVNSITSSFSTNIIVPESIKEMVWHLNVEHLGKFIKSGLVLKQIEDIYTASVDATMVFSEMDEIAKKYTLESKGLELNQQRKEIYNNYYNNSKQVTLRSIEEDVIDAANKRFSGVLSEIKDTDMHDLRKLPFNHMVLCVAGTINLHRSKLLRRADRGETVTMEINVSVVQMLLKLAEKFLGLIDRSSMLIKSSKEYLERRLVAKNNNIFVRFASRVMFKFSSFFAKRKFINLMKLSALTLVHFSEKCTDKLQSV